MSISAWKLVFFILLSVATWFFAAFTQADGFFAASAVWLATGIIIRKLDKIERLLKELKSGPDDGEIK